MRTIGIISDTHGLLRPEAEQRLAGVAHIIHAGDIGRAELIARLGRIAVTGAIRPSPAVKLRAADNASVKYLGDTGQTLRRLWPQ
ncbi:metallophosphoesterase family protein, partial [Bradyrhizobium sp.]|uniref:metallophosphoesterase family protein n=1 Tax=Bradyrhizobium sp. TaxID=376 RepID=UPI00391961A4